MKWFREHRSGLIRAVLGALLILVVCAPVGRVRMLFKPGLGSARWIENVPAGSELEKALFRAMQLPGGEILYRRPPAETVPALTALEQTQKTAALYSLRALEEEQSLDFAAAERDWKAWAAGADDRVGAQLDLANFYERRLKPREELAALEAAGDMPADAKERWTAVESQRSWEAFERALKVADEFGLGRAESARIYGEWMKRYPREPQLYARTFGFRLDGKEFAEAAALIVRYKAAFPDDRVFPVKAEAELAVRRGSVKDGLAVYDARFEPLWPAELVKDYIDLVVRSHGQRTFSDALRAKLSANPDDLRDAARLFYLYQQQGQLDSAKAVFAKYREQKEARGANWSAEELDTFEKLYEGVQDFPEAARYAYAQASDRSAATSERKGVIALTRILLTAPEQPLRVGAGNLALYKSIATMDRGPGYLNGILSLFLNTQGPADAYASEDQTAVPYFHRARAAQLLKEIDTRFADDPARPQLHASLMEAYAIYGEDVSVIREGTRILSDFPKYSGRVTVALELADAYERTRQPDKEFAVYQDLLKELAADADGVPLGDQSSTYSKPVNEQPAPAVVPTAAAQSAPDEDNGAEAPAEPAKAAPPVRSAQYAQVLDRYLGRLTSLHRLPEALSVLRGELDRNPQDPGLYQKLADFLEQNALNSHEEEVYQRAVQQFQDTSWYAKLARFYIRQKRNADYRALMNQVTDIFSGTELESYLDAAPAPDKSLALQVNLYAYQHFPHDLGFVERLIGQYSARRDYGEVEKLLWAHWWEKPELRNELFETLSRTGTLDAQLATLHQQAPEIEKAEWVGLATRNPAAERFWLEACLWRSHYEAGVDAANALANAYPADAELGEQASSLYRSLAYFHPEDTDKAVGIEKRLLDSDPGNLDRLARIGDIYADRDRIGEAAPYWLRMAEVKPGDANGYLQSATVFWDYFDFAAAQEQLEKARAQLNQPTLFGYQAGSIAESRGDMAGAVRDYAASAISDSPSNESRDRLFALARRPALRQVVEQGTADLLKQAAPSAAAIQVRARILEVENRKPDLVAELNQLIARTGSFDVLDAVSATAQSQSLADVEESSLRRQIALTTDPVRNLQLQYQLVDLLQTRNAAAARNEIDAIYREHSKILGVVRSTVDYDWAHLHKQDAVKVLLDSADAAYPELKDSFRLEAARKLTDMGETAQARTLLTDLMAQKPLEAKYEAAMAENFAHSGDQAGLANFYRTQLDVVRKSTLEKEEKQQRVAQLRRGMISAASLLGNYSDAVDQYIELINAYPDDAALVQEAALYALAHGQRDRIIGFYQKTINDSPRDPRWSIVLARVATAAEDDALAVDAYGKALKLRPERQDLYSAQAQLLERLHRLNEAIDVYRKLYVLSYRDPQWMETVAELSARQGKNADAVKALETAWIEGRPAKASNSFTVAARLETWGLLDEARRYAEQGVEQAGPDLLVSEQAGATTYARILARQRKTGDAFTRLARAREQAPSTSLTAIAQQVVKEGPGAVTDEEWRKQREEERRSAAKSGFAQAMNAIGQVVRDFYTPEEKAAFAAWLKPKALAVNPDEMASVYLPAVKVAGLSDVTSDLTWVLVQHSGGLNSGELSTWVQLERDRMRSGEAAARIEQLAGTVRGEGRAGVLDIAWNAYRDAGDKAGELRVAQQLTALRRLQGDELTGYYRLLLERRPERLLELAQRDNSAVQFLVEHGSADQALAGVAARARQQLPVWGSAYIGITGLYLREYRPDIKTDFVAALNADASIGERMSKPADRNTQLAGGVWFYYGSRYGEFLDGEKNPEAIEYLDSELEHTPGSSQAYLQLANYSREAGRDEAALSDYQHSVDLDRDQPAVFNSIANLKWKEGRQAEALTAWDEAVKQLAAEMDARRVPETFWFDFQKVIGSIAEHGQYDQLRDPIEAMMRTYLRRNGDYRSEPLLEAGFHANHDSLQWLFVITASANDQAAVLSSLLPNEWSSQGKWLSTDDVANVLKKIYELRESKASGMPDAEESLNWVRLQYADALVKAKKLADLRTVLAQVSEAKRNTSQWLPYVLASAEADATLERLLAEWKRAGDKGPADQDLRAATANLNEHDSRAVNRFVYERALERRELTAPNFLGLAAIRLEDGDTPGAVALLKRLTMVSSDMYADMDSAAQLLEDRRKPAEAIAFLKPLADDSPWNAEYRVRLAKAMLATNAKQKDALVMLTGVVNDPKAAYRVREIAALALRGNAPVEASSAELQMLASTSCPAGAEVSMPYFVQARVRAAQCSKDSGAREYLLRDALAADPQNSRLRLLYIWSAFEARSDSRALTAAERYLMYVNGYTRFERGRDEREPVSQPDVVLSTLRGGGTAAETPAFTSLSRSDGVLLLRLAAAAYEREGQLPDAKKMISAALDMVDDPKVRAALEESKKRLDVDRAREQANETRAPHVREELDQDRIVRPRLLPGMAIPEQRPQEDQE